MSKHTHTVKGYDGTLEELAQAIGALRYDAAAELFKHLEDEYTRQSKEDGNRGRRQLSGMLEHFAKQFRQLHFSLARIWELCKPYMRIQAPPTAGLPFYRMTEATAGTMRESRISGTIAPMLGVSTRDARALAAASFISSVILDTPLSSAPRNTPGNTRALFI